MAYIKNYGSRFIEIGGHMPDNHDKIAHFFTELSNAVIHAIKKGTPEDRKRLIGALEQMNAGMPAMSVENANAKEFLIALVGLLVGDPEPADNLVEPYADIYAQILEAVFAGHEHHDHHHHGHAGPSGAHSEEEDLQMKEFLTQLAASVVMVGKKGTAEDKKALSDKLREVHAAIPEEEKGPRALVMAFASILDGKPADPSTLPSGFKGIYGKVLTEVSSSSH